MVCAFACVCVCVCVYVCVHCNGDGHIIVSGRRLKGLDLYQARFTDIRIIGQRRVRVGVDGGFGWGGVDWVGVSAIW